MASFQTILSPAEGFYKEKGSKFYAYIYPASNEEAIKAHLAGMKKLHPKARHICYAWRLGATGEQYRLNDDGEPSNTAGAPIFGQLRSFEITNVLGVVVRYFGGTKLGVGGLIHAYKEASADALQKAEIITGIEKAAIQVECPYPALGELQNFIKQNNVDIVEQRFEIQCFFQLAVPLEDEYTTVSALTDLKDVTIIF